MVRRICVIFSRRIGPQASWPASPGGTTEAALGVQRAAVVAIDPRNGGVQAYFGGTDANGYRAEFMQLIDMARVLVVPTVTDTVPEPGCVVPEGATACPSE